MASDVACVDKSLSPPADRRFALSPRWQLLLLAAIWTLLNCLKPVHIDDASYLKFAPNLRAIRPTHTHFS